MQGKKLNRWFLFSIFFYRVIFWLPTSIFNKICELICRKLIYPIAHQWHFFLGLKSCWVSSQFMHFAQKMVISLLLGLLLMELLGRFVLFSLSHFMMCPCLCFIIKKIHKICIANYYNYIMISNAIHGWISSIHYFCSIFQL